jgi:hypothetical protein
MYLGIQQNWLASRKEGFIWVIPYGTARKASATSVLVRHDIVLVKFHYGLGQ